jgi:hypothetical protein
MAFDGAPMTRPIAVSAVLLLILGCGPEKPARQTMAMWRLSSTPTFDVGVGEGEPAKELDGAGSSLRLADGRVLIANSGSSEIRIFDSQGKFISSIGRKGAGPGEFTGAIQLIPISGGFAAYDRGQDRLSSFDTAGRFVNAELVDAQGSSTPFPLWVWLYRANWIVGPPDSSTRQEIAGSLLKMGDPPSDAYRFVQIASDDRLWSQVRMRGDSVEPWQVHASDGTLVAIADLPRRFEIHQIGPHYVLGRHWDTNDVEHIRIYGVGADSNGSTTVTPSALAVRDTTGFSSFGDGLKISLRNLVTAQEAFYADSNRYATRSGSLNWEPESGGTLHLMEADRRGWVGLAVHDRSPVLCGMAVGSSTPPGWPEGAPRCSTP